MFESIQQWMNNIIESQFNSPFFFIAVLLLGFIAAIGSCCNLGIVGVVTSYAGTQTKSKKNGSFLNTGISFIIGNIISLSLIGALTGFVSQTVGKAVGEYWTLVAGIVVIYFGLSGLNLLPFKISFGSKISSRAKKIANKGFFFGLVLGGFSVACSACCNPIFPVILGISYLQGEVFRSWITLLVFAVGFSLPLGAILVGLGFGFDAFSKVILKNKQIIRIISCILLVLIGFGLLLGWV